jgi:hypothetical protein
MAQVAGAGPSRLLDNKQVSEVLERVGDRDARRLLVRLARGEVDASQDCPPRIAR